MTVRIEVIPRFGGEMWAVTVNGDQITPDLRRQKRADEIAELLGNAVAVGQAEAIFKDQKGRIRKGGDGKRTYGRDPRPPKGSRG